MVTIAGPLTYAGWLFDSYDAVVCRVRAALAGVVSRGTAGTARIQGVVLAGKTGTAQFGVGGLQLHGWFTSFAPYNNPEIAMAILVEGGGEGFSSAEPVAKVEEPAKPAEPVAKVEEPAKPAEPVPCTATEAGVIGKGVGLSLSVPSGSFLPHSREPTVT